MHYPVPSDDILDGWLWATNHADEMGTLPGDLHLGGASAGGNLVAGVTKRLRDGAGSQPASLVLVYPIVHPELPPLSAELQEKLAGEKPAVSFPAGTVREFNLQYAGSESLFGDPYAFAVNGPLAGQPPVYILNSEVDFLRASGEAYGEGLRIAGVDVTVETEPGTHHGHLNGPDEPGAFASIDRLTSWLRDHGTGQPMNSLHMAEVNRRCELVMVTSERGALTHGIENESKYPYQDPQLPVERRVADLWLACRLEDKAGLLFHDMVAPGDLDAPNTLVSLPSARTLVTEFRLRHFNLLGALPDGRQFRAVAQPAPTPRRRAATGVPVTLSTDPRHHFTDNPLMSIMAGPFSQWPEPLGLAAIGSEQIGPRVRRHCQAGVHGGRDPGGAPSADRSGHRATLAEDQPDVR